MGNGWYYGEAGNSCVGIREIPAVGRLSMNLTRWDDLSDSVVFWKQGLPPFPEDEAASDRGYDVEILIDRRAIPLLSVFAMENYLDQPGPSYRIGIRQKQFIAALATGRTLQIRRAGKLLATFPIARSATMAGEMRKCVAKDPSL